jgi:hypothetical protein
MSVLLSLLAIWHSQNDKGAPGLQYGGVSAGKLSWGI